jgi:hypothetical protein
LFETGASYFDARQKRLKSLRIAVTPRAGPKRKPRVVINVDGVGLRLVHRGTLNSAISFDLEHANPLVCEFCNDTENSTGDLTAASRRANSEANCILARAISISFA